MTADSVQVSNIALTVAYGGFVDFSIISEPFFALGPVSATNTTVPWPQLPTAQGIGLNMGMCIGGTRRAHFSTMFKSFLIPAIRRAKTFFDRTLSAHPQFARSSMVWESYPLQAVKAVPSASTAYPHRDQNILS